MAIRRPLDGMLVLDLGQIYNGPYCGLSWASWARACSRSSRRRATSCAAASARSSPSRWSC